MSPVDLSIVIATFNRAEVLLSTLHRIRSAIPKSVRWETVVVDNASTDETAARIAGCVENLSIVGLKRNFGSCAKAFGVGVAQGKYVLFLDDDSYPLHDSVGKMIGYLESHPSMAAAGFRVRLPTGDEECGAFGEVFVGCGVGLRREAVIAVGGLDRSLFMQAEEYDLAFRLVAAGWDIRRFDDLWVEHLKTPRSRVPARTHYYDTRNNLLLTYRYLPDEWGHQYRRDWRQRYAWLAQDAGAVDAFERAEAVVERAGPRQRKRFAAHRLSEVQFDRLLHGSLIQERMEDLASDGIQRVLFVGLGKNIYGFLRAAKAAGIEVVAVADDRFAAADRDYRGVPILRLRKARNLHFDAAVISDTSPVHARLAQSRALGAIDPPIHRWFGEDLRSLPQDPALIEAGVIGR